MDKRRKQAAKALKMTAALILLIEARIIVDWSPEQISGLLKDELGYRISHERIYQHIWADKRQGGTLYKHLRQSNKRRKKQYGSKDISEAKLETVSALMNAPPSLQRKHALAIGRLIR
jgi:IS30 family transposase